MPDRPTTAGPGATPTKLMQLLQRIFQAQSREVMQRVAINGGQMPDTTAWVRATADAVKPMMLQLWQDGMVQASARMAAKVGRSSEVAMPRAEIPPEPTRADVRRVELGNEAVFGPRKSLVQVGRAGHPTGYTFTVPLARPILLKRGSRIVCKASGRKTQDLDFSFDLFNPRVLDAVDRATYAFCRETTETATGDLATALDELREQMRLGLPQGEAVESLARRVRSIFADPMRAFRIATTEGSRAIHGGQMMAAEEAGVEEHTWLASSDACDKCLDLDDKTVKIGQPFYVDPKGGHYAIILHPPLHPSCFCTTTEEL